MSLIFAIEILEKMQYHNAIIILELHKFALSNMTTRTAIFDRDKLAQAKSLSIPLLDEVDIVEDFKLYIKDIDDMRSHVNIVNATNDKIFIQAFNDKNYNFDILNSKFIVDKDPKESRFHAFIRMLGLPIVDKNGNIMNPGFDPTQVRKTKLNIVANQKKDDVENFNLNERAVQSFKKDLSNPSPSNIVSGIGMLQLINFTSFPTLSDQKIKISRGDIYGGSFNNYTNCDGVPVPSVYQYFTHLILTQTDGRVDISVQPSERRVVTPFLSDLQSQGVDGFVYKRPYLEQIIKYRFITTTDTEESKKNILDQLNDDPDLTNTKYLDTINKNLSVSDLSIVNGFLNKIDSYTIQLIDSVKVIHETSEKYNWIPIPNSNGPEYGVSSQNIFLNDPSALNTKADKDLIKQMAKQFVNSLIAKPIVKQGDSVLKMPVGAPESVVATPEKTPLEKAIDSRNEQFKKACEAATKIEMILGGYSGFGLLDYLAFNGALYSMDKLKLLSLLDENAFARAIGIVEGVNISTTRINYSEAISEFKNFLDIFYNIINNSIANSIAGEPVEDPDHKSGE